MVDLAKGFVDVGGAALRARKAELALAAALEHRAPAVTLELLHERRERAIAERDVLIAQLDAAIEAS